MPIEFRCTQCEKLLRTGDDTAGKQAKCPECGAMMAIPVPEAPSTGPVAGSPGDFQAAAPPAPFASAPQSENPYQSPASLAQAPAGLVPAGEIRPTQIDFNETLSKAWSVFGDRWLSVLAAIVIVGIISIISSVIQELGITPIAKSIQERAVGITLIVIYGLFHQILVLWLSIGAQMFTLGVVRGEEPQYGLVFAGGRFLLPVILAAILTMLIVMLGLVLLIIPGIIFAMMLMQAQLLIIDRNIGVTDALSLSRAVMAGNKLTVFALGLVVSIVGMLFVLVTCGLGYFAFIPFMAILNIVIYLGVTGQPTMADHYGMTPQAGGASPFAAPQGGDSPFGSSTGDADPNRPPAGDSPFAS